MSVYRRRDHWHYDFSVRGARYRAAIPEARTRREAETAEATARLAVYQGRYGKPSGDTSLIHFAETTWAEYVRHNHRRADDLYYLPQFRAFFGHRTLAEITPLLIERYKRERRAQTTRAGRPLSPATINRELAALSKIFTLAIHARLTDSNPVRQVAKLRLRNGRERILTPAEETRLFDALAFYPTLRLIVLIALHTGLRQGEILKLRRADLDLSARLLHVRDTKSGRDRVVPLSSALHAELAAQGSDGDWLFPGRRAGQHLTEIKRAWTSSLRAAGISSLTFHDLRHTAATRLAEVGADAFTIAAILGHSDLRMTQRYTHATDERRRAAIEQIGQFAQTGHKFATHEKSEPLRLALTR